MFSWMVSVAHKHCLPSSLFPFQNFSQSNWFSNAIQHTDHQGDNSYFWSRSLCWYSSFLKCCVFSPPLLSVVISVSDSNFLRACIWHSGHRIVVEKYISTIKVGIQVTTMQQCKGGTVGQMLFRHHCPPWWSVCLGSGSPGSNLVSEWLLTAVWWFSLVLTCKSQKTASR